MTTTTNASLTDRYVAAALKGVQADQREDVAAELRGSIADAVDVRTAQGESPTPLSELSSSSSATRPGSRPSTRVARST